jgi:cytochrome c5
VKQCLALILLCVGAVAAADRVPPGTADEIRERLKPVGEICKAGESCGQATAGAAASGAGLGLSGEAVYNQFCFACHTAGVGGAPLVHDMAAWESRLAKGPEALLTTMLNGLNAMPPKGTCMGCSNDELNAALDFMASAAP